MGVSHLVLICRHFSFVRDTRGVQPMRLSQLSFEEVRDAIAESNRPLLFNCNALCQALNSVPRDQGRERWKPHIDRRFAELLAFKDPSGNSNYL